MGNNDSFINDIMTKKEKGIKITMSPNKHILEENIDSVKGKGIMNYFKGPTPNQLIEQLQKLTEEQRSLPIVTNEYETDEFPPFYLDLREAEMSLVEIRYKNSHGETYLIPTEDPEPYRDDPDFIKVIGKQRILIV